MRKFVIILLALPFLFFGLKASATSEEMNLYFFYGDGCPHCAKEEILLDELEEKYDSLNIYRYEVKNNPDNAEILIEAAKELNTNVSGVPVLIIGDQVIVGYLNYETTGKKIESLVDYYHQKGCSDYVAPIISGTQDNSCIHGCNGSDTGDCTHDCGCNAGSTSQNTDKDDIIHLPVFGEVNSSTVSLPLITILIGALDGFNPCAMWVLVFLISMLLGMENRRKMWILGLAFILTSGFVYFLFLAAWLSVFRFVGMVRWIQLIVAIVAIWSGYHHLREYYKNKKGVCHVTDKDERKKTFDKIKEIIKRGSFWWALIGIVMLAAAVNLVELVCSAGLPAVYTQLLAINELATWQYYGYLLLYILIFMLDDFLIFAIAMTTLKLKGISSKYTRWSNLIGGIAILIIGILLLFKPGWLAFG